MSSTATATMSAAAAGNIAPQLHSPPGTPGGLFYVPKLLRAILYHLFTIPALRTLRTH